MARSLVVTALLATVAAATCLANPHPGLFEGWFTRLSNNPAFMCNKAQLGDTYDNVVIQTRVHSFDNEDDDTYTGSDCEVLPTDDCDVNVKVLVDTTNPTENWPADMQMTELVQEWDANDVHPKYYPNGQQKYAVGHKQHSYTACKFVPKLSLATIRVALEDVDVGTRNDIINHFNCHWAPPSGGVAKSEEEAQWETINCCTAYGRKMKSTVKHELKMDVRVFQETARDGLSSSCPNNEGRLY